MSAVRCLFAVTDALPVAFLAVIAGAGSFTHIRDTAAQHGQTGPMSCVMAVRERQRDKQFGVVTRRLSWPTVVLAVSMIERLWPTSRDGNGACFGGQGLPPPPSRPGRHRRLAPFDANVPACHIDSDITAWFPGSRQLPITSDHLSPVLLSVLTTYPCLPIGSDHFRVRFDMICLVKTDKKADRARRTDSKARHGEAAEPGRSAARPQPGRRAGLGAARARSETKRDATRWPDPGASPSPGQQK